MHNQELSFYEQQATFLIQLLNIFTDPVTIGVPEAVFVSNDTVLLLLISIYQPKQKI